VIAAEEAWKDGGPSHVWQERTHRLSIARVEAADAGGNGPEMRSCNLGYSIAVIPRGKDKSKFFIRRLKWNRMRTNDEEVEAGCNRSAGARRDSPRGSTTQDKKFGVCRRRTDFPSSAEAGAALAKAAKSWR
jgi:hypothetical protein